MTDHHVSKISLLTGGADRPYNLGLLQALVQQGMQVDFIANDDMQDAEIAKHPLVNYLNLRGAQRPDASPFHKIARVLLYYFKLIRYAFHTDSHLFHIQWYNKFVHLDRTVMNLYYKVLGKKLVFTAHNVNQGQRDGNDTFLNRLTLKWSYKAFDHIFVHTPRMKRQLISEFSVRDDRISVIRFGINSTNPVTHLSRERAREILSLSRQQKTLLFFGNIAPYKGLEYLILALARLKTKWPDLRLIIAGPIKDCDEYWRDVRRRISEYHVQEHVIEKIEYVPENEVEIYFKAADVLVLPYKFVFQSGVVFLSYNFGLPVIAANVGEIQDDVVEGETGYVFEKENCEDLVGKIDAYFNSELYKDLSTNRQHIIDFAKNRYSWDEIGRVTCRVYNEILQPRATHLT